MILIRCYYLVSFILFTDFKILCSTKGHSKLCQKTHQDDYPGRLMIRLVQAPLSPFRIGLTLSPPAQHHHNIWGIWGANGETSIRSAPSMEAHHHVNGPNTGRNSGGRGIIKINKKPVNLNLVTNLYKTTKLYYRIVTMTIIPDKCVIRSHSMYFCLFFAIIKLSLWP